MQTVEFKVPHLYQSKRIDAYLTERLEGQFSRSQLKACFDNHEVLLNGKPARPRDLVNEGDVVSGALSVENASGKILAQDIPVSVLHEDAKLLIIDKPVGMVVHPGAGNKKDTLVNALLGRGTKLAESAGLDRPGIVHRLDKETSGVLIVAKDNRTHKMLQDQFASREISKHYTALVRGRIEFQEGRICEPIGRHLKVRHKMAVSHTEKSKEAESRYRVIQYFKRATLVDVEILTGRTHQIRVHMLHLGHPVVGDEVYGPKEPEDRLMLHASKIAFTHPGTGKIISFESPLPADFKKVLEKYKKEK
jgi:23S rRNA pseudouridine1911/1915/1917 synthase